MKVLNVVSSMDLNQGGPPEVVRNLKKFINKKKNIISVFPLARLRTFYFFSFFLFKKKRKKLYKFINKYDIIHFHHVWSLKVIMMSYISHLLGIKVIISSHGYLVYWSINASFFKKKIFMNLFFQKIIYRSKMFFSNIGEYQESKKQVNFSDACVIPNGIDLSFFKTDQNLDKLNNKPKKIVFFGRIHKKKGVEILLKVISKLPKNFFDNFIFEITGPGENNYIQKIKKMIHNFNLNSYVAVLPPKSRNNKISYLKNVDIFILPSYEEGDSIALKEAMALGIPVIISEQCRMNIVEENKAGFIVKTEFYNLKKTILSLVNFDLKKMGINARNIITNNFDNETCCNRVLKIYEDVYTGSYNSIDWINY